MAQAEDTELRDLVIEALEKNGSLAKIRALLRANIFLAFEDECENLKQNVHLDNILKIPEGVLALSIVHEFLEFCNLKNTLFVYMSESRQGSEYTYEGRNILTDRLHFLNGNQDSKEPVLVTFVKNILRPFQRKYYEQGDVANVDRLDFSTGNNRKDDQNCTYIVHEDSSTSTSNSTSDNSSDEKNKLHLKLPLDNSDTDTSSDSAREKMSSEYIPNQHILTQARSDSDKLSLDQHSTTYSKQNILSTQHIETQNMTMQNHIQETKTISLNSSESTSYVDIKSYEPSDQNNQTPVDKKTENNPVNPSIPSSVSSHSQDKTKKADSISSATNNSISSLTQKPENGDTKAIKNNMWNPQSDEPAKSDTEATEYSLDFSLSPTSKNKNLLETHLHLPEQISVNVSPKDKTSPLSSPLQNSQSSQSSVSISDVADLIEYSDKNYLFENSSGKDNVSGISPSKVGNKSKNISAGLNLSLSEDSGDFSESPIPSLSNLSLDVHSD